jgi:hypothetical protein
MRGWKLGRSASPNQKLKLNLKPNPSPNLKPKRLMPTLSLETHNAATACAQLVRPAPVVKSTVVRVAVMALVAPVKVAPRVRPTVAHAVGTVYVATERIVATARRTVVIVVAMALAPPWKLV